MVLPLPCTEALTLIFIYWSVRLSIHPGDRKWPGSVESAEHDRTPALTSHWCKLITAPSSTIWCQSR